MKEKILVPAVGESVTQGTIASWLKREGQSVEEGEELFELETDKATVAVPAQASGVLHILVEAGRDVEIGAQVGELDTSAGAAKAPAAASARPGASPVPGRASPAPGLAPEHGLVAPERGPDAPNAPGYEAAAPQGTPAISSLARKVIVEHNLDTSRIVGTGPGGRITKEDALRAAGAAAPHEAAAGQAVPEQGAVAPEHGAAAAAAAPAAGRAEAGTTAAARARGGERETREPMSRLRRSLAAHLVQARQQTALTTTYNEADMSAVQDLRARHGEDFERRHGVRLGLMSFFVKACCGALKDLPVVNSRIEGEQIVTCRYYDIGVAVSTERGLLVPVLRDADALSFADIEKRILDLAQRARERRIAPEELAGGTFTITNGGVFGSLLSAPLPNFPQSAILGMHAIQRRPVAREEQVVIRPMMYLALSYDHRLIDGREAVLFLVKVKQAVEEPERLLLDQ